MTRVAINYSDKVDTKGSGYDVSTPTAGLYKMRMRSGGVYGAVRIWKGAPHDPVTGEEMDRSHRWQATINGEYVELDRVWPQCGRDPITQAEADRLLQLYQWAQGNAHESAYANLRAQVDHLSPDSPLQF